MRLGKAGAENLPPPSQPEELASGWREVLIQNSKFKKGNYFGAGTVKDPSA